jgi:proteasome accessory factor C
MTQQAPTESSDTTQRATPRTERRDRLERLTNLVLVLLDANAPLSLREITDRVAGYPAGKESVRQAFERDKRALRDLGIPVTNVAIPGADQVGYVIRAEDYYLPELGLDEAEAQALAFAVAAVHLGGTAGRDALSTLGQGATDGATAVAVLPSLPALSTIHEALRSRALLRFGYHGREREVEPYGLSFRNAAWYLVARDRSANSEVRTFRVDRMQTAPELGEAGAYTVPPDLDLAQEIHLLPFSSLPGEQEELPIAELEVDARLAREVAAIVPTGAVEAWGEDGSARIRLSVGDLPAFVSFVAGLGDTAVVHGPPEIRQAVIDRLTEMRDRAPSRMEAPEPAAEAPEPAAEADGTPEADSTPESSPRSARRAATPAQGLVAGERLRRLLAVLVHLARVGEAEIGELAARFEMDEAELVHDLELAACCGVPPYTPDQLIELFVDGDHVTAFAVGHLARPRRLTPEEGFALAAAGEALCGVEGAGEESALRSALEKLNSSLGNSRLSVEVGQPRFLAELNAAVSEHEQVEIDYVSSATPEQTTRRVDPYQVVLREGRWYLDAYCHLAGDLRRFQVERVMAVRGTGARYEAPAELDEALTGPNAFVGGPETVRVRIAFPAGSEIGVEHVAASPIEPLPDGRLATDVLVADVEGFLGRLLLRLGPGAEVLSPPALATASADAARRALERYT